MNIIETEELETEIGDCDEQAAAFKDFDGDMLDGWGIISFSELDENGFFDNESTDLDDEDNRPLDSIYRF